MERGIDNKDKGAGVGTSSGKPGFGVILSHRQAVYLLFVQVTCGLILIVDVTSEVWTSLFAPYALVTRVHVFFETMATCMVAAGALLTLRQIRFLQNKVDDGVHRLRLLRSEFDDVLKGLFKKWQLSKSESDVALLTVRGLRISDIATNRRTKTGTIKAQLSTIFRKAGVSSRPELLALIMDELLDFKPLPVEADDK
jgi:DNA-binding CsgD family transcriptional regulator